MDLSYYIGLCSCTMGYILCISSTGNVTALFWFQWGFFFHNLDLVFSHIFLLPLHLLQDLTNQQWNLLTLFKWNSNCPQVCLLLSNIESLDIHQQMSIWLCCCTNKPWFWLLFCYELVWIVHFQKLTPYRLLYISINFYSSYSSMFEDLKARLLRAQ